MPIFLVLRGAPGCGKSTWIADNDLQDYTVSSDDVRLDIAGTMVDADGIERISQKNAGAVWAEINRMLEEKAQDGEPVIILDSTGTKRKDIASYDWMYYDYGYQCYGVDFYSYITEDECKKRNASREGLRIVPEHVIEKFYENIEANPVPDFFEGSIVPEVAIEKIEEEVW